MAFILYFCIKELHGADRNRQDGDGYVSMQCIVSLALKSELSNFQMAKTTTP